MTQGENGWNEYEKLVLAELKRLSGTAEDHTKALGDISTKFASMSTSLEGLKDLPDKVSNLRMKVAGIGAVVALLVSGGMHFILRVWR